jgi:protein SCO1
MTLVTIDPEVDTPDRLKVFADENKMHSGKWLLLNGSEGDILELAALTGVKYKKTSGSDYAHSNIITVLNRNGEIAHQQTGLEQDPTETIKAIEKLVR